jgi:hypothetical protein
MPTIVEQIQHDALDQNVPVSGLLRRVKLAAAKLGLEKVEEWVDSELKGYDQTVPPYRIVKGSPVVLNPYRGWLPLGGDVESLSRRAIGQSIASLEHLVRKEDDGQLSLPFSDSVTKALNDQNDSPWATYALFVDRSQIVGILDKVRTLVLEWAIELERAGITGTEFSFRQDEMVKAQEQSLNITIGTIGQFTGNLGAGNTSGAITASDLNLNQVREFVDQVRSHADDLERAGVPRETFEQSLAAIQEELTRQAPDQGKMRALVTDVRNAVSGAAGNLVASGVLALAGRLLGG